MIARKAGKASSKRPQSILPTGAIMNSPTSTSAGEVAMPGTSDSSGDRNRNGRNSSAITSAVRPVRPPWATPAPDSIKVWAALVPSGAAIIEAKASTVIERLRLRGLPLASLSPADSDSAMKHDSASKKLVNSITKIKGR